MTLPEALAVLGTIHSHPDREDPNPSEHDCKESYKEGEKVFAIYSYMRTSSGRFMNGKVGFWATPNLFLVKRISKKRKPAAEPKMFAGILRGEAAPCEISTPSGD